MPFKSVDHAEAFNDATRLAIADQEEVGLDIITDGQMCFDDYVGVRQCVEGVDAKIDWHFCYGNAWGNRLAGRFPTGYESLLRLLRLTHRPVRTRLRQL